MIYWSSVINLSIAGLVYRCRDGFPRQSVSLLMGIGLAGKICCFLGEEGELATHFAGSRGLVWQEALKKSFSLATERFNDSRGRESVLCFSSGRNVLPAAQLCRPFFGVTGF